MGIQPQSPGWGLWWHRGQLNWKILCKECSLSATVKPSVGSVDRPSRRQTSMCGGGGFTVGESCVRNARYGHRGVRVGEASNPGSTPQTRNRPRVDVAEGILANLEHNLTHIDSDEPLQGGIDRNVVPRFDRHILQVGSKMSESSRRQIQLCLWIQICRCRHETVCWMHSNMIWCARV